MAFARLYISKFSRGRVPPDPPTTLAATPLVGKTNARPSPKTFLTRTPMASHDMIKFGRANSPETPPPRQTNGSFAPVSE